MATACKGKRFPSNHINACAQCCILSKQCLLSLCHVCLLGLYRAKLPYLNSDHRQAGFWQGYAPGHNPDERDLSGPGPRYHTPAWSIGTAWLVRTHTHARWWSTKGILNHDNGCIQRVQRQKYMFVQKQWILIFIAFYTSYSVCTHIQNIHTPTHQHTHWLAPMLTLHLFVWYHGRPLITGAVVSHGLG